PPAAIRAMEHSISRPEAAPTRRNTAVFRFYAELNDFLPPPVGVERVYRFNGNPAVKDAIEAQGVPHAEVELILVEGRSVGFGHRLADGYRVAVYPVFESFDVAGLVRVRPAPLRRSRFVVDVNLGKLARWLRLLGFDTLYRNDYADAEVVRIAAEEGRIVLTRDRRLLHHAAVTHGYWVRAVESQAQVAEVLRRFQLEGAVAPFRRCLGCNGLIHPVAKEAVQGRLEPKTRRYYDEFHQCEGCGKVYWRGPHYARLENMVSRLLAPPTDPSDATEASR
ncbi:MAG TPA: Mut7-C RNAse domain-containing protein, partial [Pseudomonadales bacterium]